MSLSLNASMCISSEKLYRCSAPGVFSMDEDSLSRDCEPFFESDGEEESTDGKSLIFFTEDNYCTCAQLRVCATSTFIFICFRLTERGCSSTVTQHGCGSGRVLGPSRPPHGSGTFAACICACVELQR